jgi:hypothetical protein
MTSVEQETHMKELLKRYDRLKARLVKVGLILQGTITERTIVEEDPETPGKKKAYGPYYQWTWKQKGKTKTVNLSASQAKTYQKAINNHRMVEDILREMREISLEICEATTEGVKKRKSKKAKDLRLS